VSRAGTTLLAGVNWRVDPGEHWAILGANGSGKTSLLAALTGYLTPSRGAIELLGRRYGRADWPALRRRVGLVSSALRQLFHEDEPALELVIGGRYAAIDLRDAPRPGDARKARRLLRLVDCHDLRDRPWAFLSQGERQRILIARALMADPDLLILDEPCAGLDPVARERFLRFIDELGRRSSPTMVLVTHHVEEIMPVFSRALVLRAGRVAASGPVGKIVSSKVLTDALGAPVRVRCRRRRFTLQIILGGRDDMGGSWVRAALKSRADVWRTCRFSGD
jgi:iron complex transport system ATP-binding protein